MKFNNDFIWGVASSAYQIEGSIKNRGLNIWDEFSNKRTNIWDHYSGNVACQHYQQMEKDIELMQQLEIQAYRFSLSWARILKDGIGPVNSEGVDFYYRLLEKIHQCQMIPFVTLYHWDLPLALHQKGGWCNSESIAWFKEYTQVVLKLFGDQIKYWIPMNEPQCFIQHGYASGIHAPGLKLNFEDILKCSFHVIEAFNQSVQSIKNNNPLNQVGLATVAIVSCPKTNQSEDIEAAKLSTFQVTEKNMWNNSWWMDPIYLREFPKDGALLFCESSQIKKWENNLIDQCDFIGMNLYSGNIVSNQKNQMILEPIPMGAPRTSFRWWVLPEIMYWGPKFFYEKYHKPIYITENGMSNNDWIDENQQINDSQRIDFLSKYLKQLHRACEEKIPILGYFHWSIMDNYEWAEGYRERFGLIYVDYASQKRMIKASGFWYQKLIQSKGNILF